MKILIPPSKSANILATIAIGEAYFAPFMKYSYPTWDEYCRRHDLGLIVFEEHLTKQSNRNWKNPYWQKFLVGKYLEKSNLQIRNVCCLDTDILISRLAPNIFNSYDESKIGLISKRVGLPFEHQSILKRVAYLRNQFYSPQYPLDSSLFISLNDLYGSLSLPVQNNEACSGVFLFNIENHSQRLSEFFLSYGKNVMKLDNGGEQTFLNYFVQSNELQQWLDYRFHALWIYEMACHYPFLYNESQDDLSLIASCIESSLFTNHFLHFAGSWFESNMWKRIEIYKQNSSNKFLEGFNEYLKREVEGTALGQIRPETLVPDQSGADPQIVIL